MDMQLFYIKSGQNEVQQYVEGTIKPDIKSYTDKYAKPIVKETVDKIAKPQIDNYIASVVLNKIDDFTQEKLSVYATRSESAAAKAETISQNVQELADNTRQDAQQAETEPECKTYCGRLLCAAKPGSGGKTGGCLRCARKCGQESRCRTCKKHC